MVVFLAALPVYLAVLGPEAYGLVGLFTTVMVAATALDLGLGATLNREVARMTAQGPAAAGFADVVTTLQAACWTVALAAGVLFTIAAPALATRWLSFSVLSATEVRSALALMGIALPALIVRSFYMAGLNGLQRQGLANLVQTTGAIVRAGLTVAALRLLAAAPVVFFAVQLVLAY